MTPEFVAPQVEFAAVSKVYGNGRVVIRALDLTIAKGEFVTFLGPSGCGKSTVLKLISGLTPPSSGTIQVDGMTPKNARETVSYIFQDPTLLPWRTVRDNVGLGLELEGVSADRRREKTKSLLDLVGLASVGDAYPRELSGGMKMTRDRLNEELLRLREEQKWTAVFVTHSVAEAVFLSTRIVVLAANPGRIHAVVPIALSFPRTAVLRSSAEFGTVALQISRILREASLS
jgi:NitT/TauT family transport system ATP-binding protein